MSSCDLTEQFNEQVNNLMSVIEQMIKANEQNQDVNVFMEDLFTHYQFTKEIQLKKANFYKMLKEELGYDKSTNSDFC